MDCKRNYLKIYRPYIAGQEERKILFYYGNGNCLVFGHTKIKLFFEKSALRRHQFYIVEAPQLRYFGHVMVDDAKRIVTNYSKHRIVEQLLSCRDKFSCVKRLYFYFVAYLGVRVDANTLDFIQELCLGKYKYVTI
jgi:hypothetical protein